MLTKEYYCKSFKVSNSKVRTKQDKQVNNKNPPDNYIKRKARNASNVHDE